MLICHIKLSTFIILPRNILLLNCLFQHMPVCLSIRWRMWHCPSACFTISDQCFVKIHCLLFNLFLQYLPYGKKWILFVYVKQHNIHVHVNEDENNNNNRMLYSQLNTAKQEHAVTDIWICKWVDIQFKQSRNVNNVLNKIAKIWKYFCDYEASSKQETSGPEGTSFHLYPSLILHYN